MSVGAGLACGGGLAARLGGARTASGRGRLVPKHFPVLLDALAAHAAQSLKIVEPRYLLNENWKASGATSQTPAWSRSSRRRVLMSVRGWFARGFVIVGALGAGVT
jgi:hypothetical protein